MIKISLPEGVRKLFHKEVKVTPKQRVLDEIAVLRTKRDHIQDLLSKGQHVEGALGSVQKEIVAKVAEYKRTLRVG